MKHKKHGSGHLPPKEKPENAVERAWRLSGRDPKYWIGGRKRDK